ncbi:MAG: plastocyanin/azurin family copper-binding protein [Nitrosopumilus sp.]|nr:plastocyanin/azurin family copper-binding protein [Nitrosopumilus sp.]MDH3735562.1 plastocyanin/azurin family copper-binding protein [Nitrosopumilus sp.]MDH3822905.1 plastocyanin/azurin family copper-binding protein [Nitrosopumilus sp.]MDH3832745.1 plastocyanin/azurin family copper-binding protein [Nitrosopumilus sp.]
MAGIDKAAIAFSVAIVAIGVGFAFYMDGVQNAGPTVSAPVISKSIEPETQMDPFADIADKVKEEDSKMEEKMMEETPEEETMMEETVMEKSVGPQTHSVEIPVGTSVPGCEETNSCYLPADITINVGDTVEWPNVDTAAHTVTSGSPADGPSGVFDSSLLMADATFAFTFEEAGSYDYFCMVHPWMIGSVTVN